MFVSRRMKALYTILLLTAGNIFMTIAWYGHLKFKGLSWAQNLGLFSIILLSWGIAFFEYTLQVPANRLGHESNGGPFSLMELKVIQEVIALLVFIVFVMIVFKNEPIKWNHFAGIGCLILAVFFILKKW